MTSLVLVIEDNPDNMKLFSWTLEDAGFDCEGVGSGEEALRALDRRPFDVVLMDISLPGMDGKETTRRIKAQERFAALPVIAVTAHAGKGETEAILAAGVTTLMTKPIDEDELIRTIRASLRGFEGYHDEDSDRG